MKPYVIVAPGFAHICAGIKVLHLLCHRLRERGFEAYVTGLVAPQEFTAYTKAVHIDALPQERIKEFQHSGVVVYPDVVGGNPLGFNNVARWWLAGVLPLQPNEATFVYNSTLGAPSSVNTLCIWDIEPFFTLPQIENRTKTCFRVHKGAHLARIPETEGGRSIEITGSFPRTRPEVARLFQESSVLYQYDDLSSLTFEARLCGCPVRVVGYTYASKDRKPRDPMSEFGISFPEEEFNLEKTRGELPLFAEFYKQKLIEADQELDRFIDITQSMDNPYVENIVQQAPQVWLPINRFMPRNQYDYTVCSHPKQI